MDSVMEAVVVMEDEGAFNAGCGSSLNIEKALKWKHPSWMERHCRLEPLGF